MQIEIKELKKKDDKKAIQFAIEGMNFNQYLENRFLLQLYGRYFWYLELTNATQILAAYMGDDLVGVLLADVKTEKKKIKSFWMSVYIKIFNLLQNLFSSLDIYEEANQTMLKEYQKHHLLDGEIKFLAADPQYKGKGIGSFLLSALEKLVTGKTLYLFTDNHCTYQFYEHRGFQRVGEKEIVLDFKIKKVPLTCFLYQKKM